MPGLAHESLANDPQQAMPWPPRLAEGHLPWCHSNVNLPPTRVAPAHDLRLGNQCEDIIHTSEGIHADELSCGAFVLLREGACTRPRAPLARAAEARALRKTPETPPGPTADVNTPNSISSER